MIWGALAAVAIGVLAGSSGLSPWIAYPTALVAIAAYNVKAWDGFSRGYREGFRERARSGPR